NVAGIEIENSYFADVYGNDSHDNTGGILVFGLPELQQEGGHDIRVHDNQIHDNNLPNFAPVGNIVGKVPAGTGSFVMANDKVEIFSNTFTNNQTAATAAVSYYVTSSPINDPNYYAYPTNVYFHDNTYVGNGTHPDQTNDLGLLLATGETKFQNSQIPDVLYDGILDSTKTTPPENPMQICVKQPSSQVANLHLDQIGQDGKTTLADTVVVDSAPFDCTLPAIAAVSFPGLN
ncbi:MAG TPA: parallel beta-helix domain-containing protein, partial [Polyangiaceae bacterium]